MKTDKASDITCVITVISTWSCRHANVAQPTKGIQLDVYVATKTLCSL